MRVWHDWEFLEDGETIKPISVGMVTEDGAELYLEFSDAPWDKIRDHEWLMDNVVPQLGKFSYTKSYVREAVYEFLKAAASRGNDLQLWGWYCAYDHVCLAQLFGRMIDLPGWCPKLTQDLKQEFIRLGDPVYPRQTEGLHNALEDARHMRAKHLWLDTFKYITVNNSRGFQVGNGNVQNNKF